MTTDAPRPIPYILDERQEKELVLCRIIQNMNHATVTEYTLREAVFILDTMRNSPSGTGNWRSEIDEETTEIVDVCRYYVQHLNHGTAGHNLYVLVATLSEMLDRQAARESQEKGE